MVGEKTTQAGEERLRRFGDVVFSYFLPTERLDEFRMPAHVLIFVYSGEMTVEDKRRKTVVHSGEYVFLRRDHLVRIHKYAADGHPYQAISIRLERDFLKEYWSRYKQSIHLNSNGRILQKALMTALPALDQAVEIITHPMSEQYGDIRMLVRSERRNILNYIYQFKQANPQVFFHISHDFNTEDLSAYDFIIDEQTTRYGNFSVRPIIKEPIRLAASRQNPLSERTLLLEDLKSSSK